MSKCEKKASQAKELRELCQTHHYQTEERSPSEIPTSSTSPMILLKMQISKSMIRSEENLIL
jgi:hypothetical protein